MCNVLVVVCIEFSEYRLSCCSVMWVFGWVVMMWVWVVLFFLRLWMVNIMCVLWLVNMVVVW